MENGEYGYLSDLFRIRQRIYKKEADISDAERLKTYADGKHSPLAEFLYGALLYDGYLLERDVDAAFRYFEICRAHASGDLQMRMAEAYFAQEDRSMWMKGLECVKEAAKDGDRQAKRMLRSARIKALFAMMSDRLRLR